ncbi:MAG: GreA/GreB family elongation factor [Bdellovibrionales bacterium]|nr:GreA/GreB family elongation factor [Bdellovibrionales bacterium]
MDKKAVIQHLIAHLEEELAGLPAKGGPVQVESPRRAEIQGLLTMYRFLPSRTYATEDPIIPTSFVTLKVRDVTSYAFIAPRGGGFITTIEGVPLQVLTASSPLGEALLGKKTGESAVVEVRGELREYLIVASS